MGLINGYMLDSFEYELCKGTFAEDNRVDCNLVLVPMSVIPKYAIPKHEKATSEAHGTSFGYEYFVAYDITAPFRTWVYYGPSIGMPSAIELLYAEIHSGKYNGHAQTTLEAAAKVVIDMEKHHEDSMMEWEGLSRMFAHATIEAAKAIKEHDVRHLFDKEENKLFNIFMDELESVNFARKMCKSRTAADINKKVLKGVKKDA